MKNLVLAFLGLITFHITNAQDNMAFVSNNINGIMATDRIAGDHIADNPLSYLQEIEVAALPKALYAFQKDLCSYDLTKNPIYDNTEAATYHVSFKKKQMKAHVTYDRNGVIMGSMERYRNVNLPESLKRKVLRENPGFALQANEVIFKYGNSSGVEITYIVTIFHGRDRKRMKFDASYRPI